MVRTLRVCMNMQASYGELTLCYSIPELYVFKSNPIMASHSKSDIPLEGC